MTDDATNIQGTNMNIKHFSSALAGFAMLGAASTVGAAGIEAAQYTEGTVQTIDLHGRTVTVGEQTYAVIGTMPDLRAGEQVDVTYMNEGGKLAAWFKSKDAPPAPTFAS
jgi:hypothetical protein